MRRHLGLAAALFAVAGAHLAVAPTASASTTTSLAASPQNAGVGQPVSFTATVTQDTGTPDGSVTLQDEQGLMPQCAGRPVQATGSGYQATCSATFNQPGTYHVTAQYTPAGGPSPNDSQSAPVTVTVSSSGTTTTLKASTTSPTPGVQVDYTATIASSSGDTTGFQGSVEFLDNGSPIPGCESQPVGTKTPPNGPFGAECQQTYSQAGSHSIVARYSGDSHYTGSESAPLAVNVRAQGSGAISCPGQDNLFTDSKLPGARTAVVCLVNAIRAQYGLPALQESGDVDQLDQQHPQNPGSPSGVRVQSGSILHDAIGYSTPYAAIAEMMRSRELCFDILGPADTIGVGVTSQPLIFAPPPRGGFSFAKGPSWTIEILGTQLGDPSNQSAQQACPHPLGADAAGQGATPPGHRHLSDLAFVNASLRNRRLALLLEPQSKTRTNASLTIDVAGVAPLHARVRGARIGRANDVVVRVSAGAARRIQGGAAIDVHVSETSPARTSYLFELRLSKG